MALINFLKEHKIDHYTIKHKETNTCDEQLKTVKFPAPFEETLLPKSLLLKNRKDAQEMWLAILPSVKKFNIGGLCKQFLKVPSKHVSFAEPEVLYDTLKCVPGMVNYFSILNLPRKNKLTLLLDKEITQSKWVSFHPFDPAQSTCINQDGMKKIRDMATDLKNV